MKFKNRSIFTSSFFSFLSAGSWRPQAMPWAVFVQECPCYYLGGCGVRRGAAVYNYLANPQKALKMYPWLSGESDSLHIINLTECVACMAQWNCPHLVSSFAAERISQSVFALACPQSRPQSLNSHLVFSSTSLPSTAHL